MGLSSGSYELPGTISAVFFNKQDAEKAYKGLVALGHSEDDISLLLSDETLNSYANPLNEEDLPEAGTADEDADSTFTGRARHLIADAILSITSMISLPELGISMSRRLVGTVTETPVGKSISSVVAAKIPQEHCDTYEAGIKEGGIIISVDPKNLAERDAIIRQFRSSGGRDILGDDGYTELN